MSQKPVRFKKKSDLYAGKYSFFEFGQVFWTDDRLVQIPQSDRVEGLRNLHERRTVVIISNNSQNTNNYKPTILIAPLSSRTDLKGIFDIELNKEYDSVIKDCIVQMESIQPICKADLIEYIGIVSNDKMAEILDAYLQMIGYDIN